MPKQKIFLYFLALVCLTLASCAPSSNNTPVEPTSTSSSTPPASPTAVLLSTYTPMATVTTTPTAPPPTPTETTLTPTLAATPAYENSFAVAFSANSRYLAFNSDIDGLVPKDHNGHLDAFLYDTARGSIELGSVFNKDEPVIPSAPSAIGLSTDGRYLLFGGMANNPVPPEEHYNYVFLRDRKEGSTGRIDLSPMARELNQEIYPRAISPDGNYLAFEVVMAEFNMYLYERATGKAVLVSPGMDGQLADGNSYNPVFSPDGGYLAFLSTASNLVAGDITCTEGEPACEDIFLYNLATHKLERVPASLKMTRDEPYHSLAISNGAQQVAWTGYGAEGGFPPVVRLLDRQSGKSEAICTGNPCSGHTPALSADGRWLTFASFSTYGDAGNLPPYAQVYLLDRQNGKLALVSADASGEPGDNNSGIIFLQQEGWNSDLRISADGRWVAFSSQAANLLPTGVEKQTCYSPYLASGAYPCYDLFVFDRQSGKLTWISRPP